MGGRAPRHRVRRAISTLVTIAVAISVAIAGRAPRAHALTGTDGLIAIATVNGIEVFDADGDGSDLHLLIPTPPNGVKLREPAWSPRGDLIAYQRGRTVWVAAADGTDAHRVSPSGKRAFGPAWSPDGRLSFLIYDDAVIMDADRTHETVIRLPYGRAGDRPAWTADGRLLLMIERDGWMVRSPFIGDGDGTDLRPLTYPDGTTPDDPFTDLFSQWRFAFNWQFSSAGLVSFYAEAVEPNRIWTHVATFDGTFISEHVIEPLGVTTNLGARDAAFSPGGHRVVTTDLEFHAGVPRTTGVTLWTVDLTSSANPLQSQGAFSVASRSAFGVDWQPRCSVVGTPGDDELSGTPAPDLICGLGGDDVISAAGGNDVIYAGPGRDVIFGAVGNDVIVGGRGTDVLHGGRGLDLINSRGDHTASDSVEAGTDHDVCIADHADSLRSCSSDP